MFGYLSFRFPGRRSAWLVLTVLALIFLTSGQIVMAGMNYCPFCAAINATFGEQIGKHEISVIAKLVEIPPEDPDAVEFPKARFEITKVIKGSDHVATGMSFKTILVGTYPVGEQFLVMGIEPPEVMWSTPMKASDRVVKYLLESAALPAQGPDRLVFFQNYFEDEESVLAFDAYDEFAIADFKDLTAMKDRMKREQLVEWVKDPDLRVDRRRLYFTMLSVCGGAEEIEMLEGLIRSGDKEKIRGLDALVSCYLMLKGEDGLKLIEEAFLKNSESDFVDINGVLSALRFHGTEVNLISQKRIAATARLALDRTKLADQVIPDLARWEDWSVVDRLVTMFKESNEENEYIRVPVVIYLRACPLPEAKEHLKELAALDPDSVARAKFYEGFDSEDDEEDDSESGESDSTKPEETEKKDKSGSEKEDEKKQDTSHHLFDSIQKVLFSGKSMNLQQVSTGAITAVGQELEDESPGPETNNLSINEVSSKAVQPPIDGLSTETFVNRSGLNQPSGSGAPKAILEPFEMSESNAPPVAIINPDLTWWIVFIPIGFSMVIFVAIWSVVNGWFERLIL